jgi:hypothetical protein
VGTKPINSQFQLRGQYSHDAAERKLKFAKSAEFNNFSAWKGKFRTSVAAKDVGRLSELRLNPSYTLIYTGY